MSQGIRLMGLWAKQAKNGETYHEGSLGGGTVRIFVNNYKRSDKDPDIVMYLSSKPKPEARQGAQTRPSQVHGQVRRDTPQQREEFRRSYQAKEAQEKAAPAYKDWTKQEGPPDDGAPWPTEEDMPF